MAKSELKINEKSIKTELSSYEKEPYKCLFEYIWNSFDAGANEININFDKPVEGMNLIRNVNIVDNGIGWNVDDHAVTNNFISSTKKANKNKTLPKGQYGRGRYAFIWISKKIEVFSRNKKLILQHNTDIEKEDVKTSISGTKIDFIGITEEFSSLLISTNLLEENILIEFGWFLLENPNYKILINKKEVEVNKIVRDTRILDKTSFPDSISKKLDENFEVKIVLWKEKPLEYSRYYFLNENNIEIYKQYTGLNKKSDKFWHSVYIRSKLFISYESVNEKKDSQLTMDFEDKEIRRIKNKILQVIFEELIALRKPYLQEGSEDLLEELKEDNLIPKLADFGIYDEESYTDLLKTIYTITPSLFVGKNKSEKKFICATFAGLLSNEDDTLIKTILEQLQELTDDEKTDLLDILNRTSLSNIIKTTKEIDHRLDVLDKLKVLISEYEKETLEVKHIQKILDENFWLFGEQFRLFSSTEGALKNVLTRYAKDILSIEEPELETKPNGEVDLFLTKEDPVNELYKRNIIVEIKRASKNLKRDIEFRQIEQYKDAILKQSLCNGETQCWEFYLIGKDYDEGIQGYINSNASHGEKEKGLAFWDKDGRVKIYVRKWSDILEVEWGTKMKYLKEKLKVQAKKTEAKNVNGIVAELV